MSENGRRRGQLSHGNLARKDKELYMLAAQIQEYLYFPTPEPLYVVLGTLAANIMMGKPVWTMLVGAPSAGKTILLDTLTQVAKVHVMGDIRGPAALLSGSAEKDISASSTGGMLREVGERGMMVIKDFTSILSLPRDPLKEIVSAMRYVYDGYYKRTVGSDGGKNLHWWGRIGFLGASTPAIDRHQVTIGELGERFVFYRYAETDGYGESMAALNTKDPEFMMEQLRKHVHQFVIGIGLKWGKKNKVTDMYEDEEKTRDLTSHEKNRLFHIGAMGAALRSVVPRDMYRKDVSDISTKETPTRMVTSLSQLYLGLERIGLDENERWEIIGKMALDSAPQVRSRMLMLLKNRSMNGNGLVGEHLKMMLKCSTRIVSDVIEDMHVNEIVELEQHKESRMDSESVHLTTYVKLTEWAREQLELGWKKGKDELR
ncbi:MAG: hypothetical protein C5B54_10930 [Acidobacteria bacterium]|nr:MAG: hypothetical protein C5B54_10930 [Acidobacteriota bacterium]